MPGARPAGNGPGPSARPRASRGRCARLSRRSPSMGSPVRAGHGTYETEPPPAMRSDRSAMTFRAKPVSPKRRRTQWEGDARQQLYVTIGFIALIILALVILAGAVAVTYYNDHWRAIARVDGADISIDQWNDRQKVEEYRLAEVDDRIRTAVSSGQLDSTTGEPAAPAHPGRGRQDPRASTRRADRRAAPGAACPGSGDRGDRRRRRCRARRRGHDCRATQGFRRGRPARRLDEGASSPTDAQRAAAKQKADAALADLKAGKAFDEVAKQYSTDAQRPERGESRLHHEVLPGRPGLRRGRVRPAHSTAPPR